MIKFVIGCLNARVNGTIYFGVGGKLQFKMSILYMLFTMTLFDDLIFR